MDNATFKLGNDRSKAGHLVSRENDIRFELAIKRLYHKSRSASFFMTEFGSIFWGDIFCVLFGIMV